jgi:sec-independent protein translocase protein TatA
MGIGFKELLIILVIVLILFGAKRLRNLGSDLGAAMKGFRQAVKDETPEDKDTLDQNAGRTIEGEVTSKDKDRV